MHMLSDNVSNQRKEMTLTQKLHWCH